jgi:N-acetylglucosamine-6-sulfatase
MNETRRHSAAPGRTRARRAAARRRTRARRTAALVAIGVGVLLALALIGRGGGDTAASHAASASDPDGMNVVVILSDDQPLRTARFMPYLIKKGPDDGWTRFTSAVVNNPLCCPSRSTLLTGLYAHHHGVVSSGQARRLDATDTIATWLQGQGYETALIGKYMNGYPWRRGSDYVPEGWSRWVGVLGTPHYYKYTLSIDGRPKHYGNAPKDYLGRVMQRKSLSYLRHHTGEGTTPFFLFVSHYAPHKQAIADPRDVGRLADERIKLAPNVSEENVSDKPRWIRRLDQSGDGRLQRLLRERAESALSVDRLVKRIVTELDRRGELDNTMLLYSTDHGYAVGEHRHERKSCAYEECIRVPLMIRYPGSPVAGERVDELVSNIDFAPTIAEVMGIETPPGRDGISLVPLLEGGSIDSSRAILIQKAQHVGASPPFWGLRTERFKYVELSTGEKELYDLHRDPYELHNRADKPNQVELQAALEEQLHGMLP